MGVLPPPLPPPLSPSPAKIVSDEANSLPENHHGISIHHSLTPPILRPPAHSPPRSHTPRNRAEIRTASYRTNLWRIVDKWDSQRRPFPANGKGEGYLCQYQPISTHFWSISTNLLREVIFSFTSSSPLRTRWNTESNSKWVECWGACLRKFHANEHAALNWLKIPSAELQCCKAAR